MPDYPYKCYEEFTDDYVKDSSELSWRIDTKWLLSQALNCHLYGHDEIVFSVIKGKLYMRGIRMADKEGIFLPQNTWIEEFPPWP